MSWNPNKEFHYINLTTSEIRKIEKIRSMKVEKDDLVNIVDKLIKTGANCIQTTSGNKIFTIKLHIDEENKFYLQFYESKCFIPKSGKFENCIVLWSIYVPDLIQNRGVATNIIKLLEDYSKNINKVFVVMMITSEWLLRICKKRNYLERPPFSMYLIA